MKQYYKFDENGYYLEPVIAVYSDEDPMPDDVTDIRPPDGLYHGRFDKTAQAWVEDAPKPDAPEGKVAVWDSETKTWSIEDEPEPPTSPDSQFSADEADWLKGLYHGMEVDDE